jgi:hypothetical protein
LTPDAETSVSARLITDEALSGSPLVRIARLLNENGIGPGDRRPGRRG